jgi:hypothetical protein
MPLMSSNKNCIAITLTLGVILAARVVATGTLQDTPDAAGLKSRGTTHARVEKPVIPAR